MHDSLHQLAHDNRLSAKKTQALWRLAGVHQPPKDIFSRLRMGVMLLAALFLGAGLIFWVAANWDAQTRSFKLHLLQAAVAVGIIPALFLYAGKYAWLRTVLLFFTTVALGGLLAFIGITYQTGADAWELFATWAVLSLIWVAIGRSDWLWAVWLCIVAAAIGLRTSSSVFGILGWSSIGQDTRLRVDNVLWLVLLILPVLLDIVGAVRGSKKHAHSLPISQHIVAFLAFNTWAAQALQLIYRASSATLGDILFINVFLMALAFMVVLRWLRQQMFIVTMAVWAFNFLGWIALLSFARTEFHLLFAGIMILGSFGYSVFWLYRQWNIAAKNSTVAVALIQAALHRGILPADYVKPYTQRKWWEYVLLFCILAYLLIIPISHPASLLKDLIIYTVLAAAWCLHEARSSGQDWARLGHWIANGVIVIVLVYSVFFEINIFTAYFASGSAEAEQAGSAQLFQLQGQHVISGIFSLASAAVLFYHWRWLAAPNSRRWLAIPRAQMGWWLLLYAVLLVLALVVSRLGILVLLFSVALATGRKRIAVLSMGVMLLQLSAFYYALQWTLLDKAYLLMMLGAVVATTAAVMYGVQPNTKKQSSTVPKSGVSISPLAQMLALAGVLLALGVTQYDVFKKENIIKHGRRIYVQLQPADPRSLMQGDYMALRFALPDDLWDKTEQASIANQAFVAAKLDARGVASVKRLVGKYETLANDEVRLPIKKLKGRWTVVTDAYFFPEGKGRIFSTARFGELRALDNGGALLVGLSDENLRLLKPIADATPHTTQ